MPKYLERELRKLEKKKMISRKPHPIFAFALFFISLFLFIIVNILEVSEFLVSLSEFTVALSLAFALVHSAIVRILERGNKKG